ncbi:LacI family DNA-binding transcriptional regulator [Dactylosporangium vinaceum]|uniref:LacI family DNA-binding transcriptional regulator n=1 Tax=Dactylosporangium vinaceum TaxID=53362 RepID=A0ABV5M9X1_9ACTN|nr:LacI family DNA-binding transcriptional regulator [Dactylosporangium vinaceum]UAB93177.1 LacI family DNA-binding transcriptional regulator [Dactylosporangium vinaceum]
MGARRPTMNDIARRVGVSRVAVSYALNDRPGVSADLRERVRAVAAELGFQANRAAVALHGASADVVGLALRRTSAALRSEVFRRQFIAGLQMELYARGSGLALQFVEHMDEEIALYRRWHAERRVDGVVLCDLRADDPRLPFVRDLGLPAVVAGGAGELPGLANLSTDETAGAAKITGLLSALGHRRVARVSGPAGLAHTAARTEALRSLPFVTVEADYTGEAAAQATRRLLSGRERPTAIVYDNDLMALAGLGVAAEMHVAVPADVSILAWEDSPLCQLVHPALTVLQRNITDYGMRTARLLFELLDGRPPRSVRYGNATLVVRDSTGPAPATTASTHPS